jgi:hypothetical protein
VNTIGAWGADLAATAGLFAAPWDRPITTLTDPDQAFILNEAAMGLRALGRLREAVAPFMAALDRGVAQEAWKLAAIRAVNLSEVYLTLGDVREAMAMCMTSVEHAKRSKDTLWQVSSSSRPELGDSGSSGRAQERQGKLAASTASRPSLRFESGRRCRAILDSRPAPRFIVSS